MLTHIDMVKTISHIDDIKGLHTNRKLASCFVIYINEHQSDYHGIIWFMFLVLLVLWAVNPLLTSGFPYRRSIVRNFLFDSCFSHCWRNVDVWLKVSALLAQCVVSPFVPSGYSSQKNRSVNILFHVCPNELLNKQWKCKWVACWGSLEWNFGGSVRGDPIAGGFPSQKLG